MNPVDWPKVVNDTARRCGVRHTYTRREALDVLWAFTDFPLLMDQARIAGQLESLFGPKPSLLSRLLRRAA